MGTVECFFISESSGRASLRKPRILSHGAESRALKRSVSSRVIPSTVFKRQRLTRAYVYCRSLEEAVRSEKEAKESRFLWSFLARSSGMPEIPVSSQSGRVRSFSFKIMEKSSAVTAIKAEKILDEVQEIMNDGELERMTAIIEKRLLAEDYSSLELAAAFLKMSMGDDYEDIAEDVRPLRDLEDLGRRGGSRGRDGRGQRDGRGNYRGGRGGRFDDLDEYEGRRSGRSGMASLFINLGKNQNVKPGDILGAIAGETGIPGRMVGSIDMYDKYTFVEVPKNQAEMVMEAMKQVKIRGKNVRVEIANRK